MPHLSQISCTGTSLIDEKCLAAMLLGNCSQFLSFSFYSHNLILFVFSLFFGQKFHETHEWTFIFQTWHLETPLTSLISSVLDKKNELKLNFVPAQSPSLRGEPSSCPAPELKPSRGRRPWRWPALLPRSPEPQSCSVQLNPETRRSSTTFRGDRCSSKVRLNRFWSDLMCTCLNTERWDMLTVSSLIAVVLGELWVSETFKLAYERLARVSASYSELMLI